MTLLVLKAYILAALVAWSPQKDHRWKEPPAVTQARYEGVAEDIALVSLMGRSLFTDDDAGRVETALVLASIASFEGGIRADVDECRTVGDHGTAFSLWQVHSARGVVCGDRAGAIFEAEERIRRSFKSCSALDQVDRLAEYASGTCALGRGASRSRVGRALHWFQSHPPVESGS